MAQPPEYRQRTSAQGGGPLGLANAPNMQLPGGSGLSELGAGIERGAQAVRKAQIDESIMAANATASQARLDLNRDLDALSTVPATEFEDQAKKLNSRWAQRRFDDRKSAGSQEARNFLELEHDRLQLAAENQIAGQRDGARQARVVQSLESSLAADSATIEANPDEAPEILARNQRVIEQSGVDQRAQAQLYSNTVGTLARAAVRGYRKRNPSALITELEKPEPSIEALRLLSPQERQVELQAARTELREQMVGGLVDGVSDAYARGITQGDRALEHLPAELSDADRFEVRRLTRARLSILQDERSRKYGPEVTDIALRIKAGAGTARDVRRLGELRELGAVTDGQRESYLAQQQDAVRRASERDAGAREVAALLTSGLPLDPTSSEHRKALAGAFEQAIGAMPVTDDRSLATALGFAKQTRMLPQQAASWLNSSARSPDMTVATRAAEFATVLRRTAPEAFGELAPDTRTFLATVGDMMGAGASRESAFQAARATIYDAPPAVLELRTKQLPAVEKVLPGVLSNLIDRDFDPGLFSAQPAATQRLQADFARQTRQYYLKTGNAQVAQDLAWSDIRRVYGRTEVNGSPELQILPPESFGVKPAQVRADISHFLESGGRRPVEPPAPQGLRTAGNIDLHSRPRAKLADGSIATVRSISIGTDQGEVLIPTIGDGGQELTNDQAIAQFRQTGKHLGVFDSPEAATAYAKTLHTAQEREYVGESLLPEGLTADRVRVVADDVTLSLVNDALTGQAVRPSYALMTDQGDVLLNADGTRARWTLPTAEDVRVQLEAERAAANAGELGKAKRDRSVRQEIQRQRASDLLDAPMMPGIP